MDRQEFPFNIFGHCLFFSLATRLPGEKFKSVLVRENVLEINGSEA